MCMSDFSLVLSFFRGRPVLCLLGILHSIWPSPDSLHIKRVKPCLVAPLRTWGKAWLTAEQLSPRSCLITLFSLARGWGGGREESEWVDVCGSAGESSAINLPAAPNSQCGSLLLLLGRLCLQGAAFQHPGEMLTLHARVPAPGPEGHDSSVPFSGALLGSCLFAQRIEKELESSVQLWWQVSLVLGALLGHSW